MSKIKAPTGTVKKVLGFISGYKLYVAVSVLLSALSVALTLYIPLLFGDAIDLIIGKGSVDTEGIIKILIKTAVLVAVSALGSWIMNTVNNKILYIWVGVQEVQKLHYSCRVLACCRNSRH